MFMRVFLAFLQQSGLRRELSDECKWKLLSIGQQVQVHSALENIASIPNASVWEKEKWAEFSNKVTSDSNMVDTAASRLLELQESVLASGKGQDVQQKFLQLLFKALPTAMTYREEQAWDEYDARPNQLPAVQSSDQVPLWTNNPTLQKVLKKQLEFWSNEEHTTAPSSSLKIFFELTMQSYRDTLNACPNTVTREALAQILRSSIMLWRRTQGFDEDEWVMELCMAHAFCVNLPMIMKGNVTKSILPWIHRSTCINEKFRCAM